MMWFAGISRDYASGWFLQFVLKLLENDRDTLKLLRYNPFPDEPPARVRARLFRYRYSTHAERRATGAWWVREPLGAFMVPVSRSDLSAL